MCRSRSEALPAVSASLGLEALDDELGCLQEPLRTVVEAGLLPAGQVAAGRSNALLPADLQAAASGAVRQGRTLGGRLQGGRGPQPGDNWLR